VAGVHHQLQAFVEERLGLDLVAVRGVEGDAHVQPAGDQLLLDRAAAQLAHHHLHAGVIRAEGGHRVGHQMGQESGDHAQGERARLQPRHVGQRHAAGLQLLQRARRVAAEGHARLRELQPAPQPVEERQAQFGLQLAQAVRQGGLGDEERVGRLREVLGLGHAQKVAQLAQFHGSSLAMVVGRSPFDAIERCIPYISLEREVTWR